MNIKRDKWGRFSRRGHTLAWVALAVVMIATGLVLTYDLDAIEYQAEVIQERDSYEKLGDALEDALRTEAELKAEYNEVRANYERAIEKTNTVIESINLFNQ